MKRRAPEVAVYEGRHLAEIGDVKAAIAAFQNAQRLDPDIDLDPTTKIIEKDPQAVAQKFADLGASKRKIQEGDEPARKRDTDKALKAYGTLRSCCLHAPFIIHRTLPSHFRGHTRTSD